MRRLKRASVLAAAALLLTAIVLADDPGDIGPYDVTRAEYNFGETAFTPPGFPGPVELQADVHYPTDLSNGPFPLIIFLHGRHATCYSGTTQFLEWPCAPGHQSIPSYIGYDYWAQNLASDGYIVVSIGANGINAQDNSVSDLGALARAQLIQKHLDIWNDFNTAGGEPFGTLFVGKVDLTNIGTMGHSRGGEGVVEHFLYNQDQGSPYNITAVLALSPSDFNRPVINNVPLVVPLGYCDGDLSDLQGVHFYDDARYNVPGDLATKHTILVMGANHNFFNTIWTPGGWPAGAADDWLAFVGGGAADPQCGTVPGNRRLTPDQQKAVLVAYGNAVFRTFMGGESAFFPFLQGDLAAPPSAMTNDLFVSYHPPDDPTTRLDVNRLLSADELTTNTLGGGAAQSGLVPYDVCGGDAPEPRFCLPGQSNSRQPHTTPSARSSNSGLSQLTFAWSSTSAFYQNDLAAPQDVSGYAVLQFRASVNYNDPGNPAGMPQDCSVTLTDAGGNTSTALVSDWSGALYFPPGGPAAIPVPKVFLNTVRIPLAAFGDVDLTQIQTVTFNFDQNPSGALLITDLLFADPAPM